MSEINTALLYDFIDESREHLDEMESLLLQLGNDLGNLDLLNDIFRTMHNVKGTSQMTGLDKIARLSHRLEDLLDLLRQGHKQTTPEMVMLFISGRDRIVELVSELEESQQELSSVDELIDALTVLIEAEEVNTQETAQSNSVQESVSTTHEVTGSTEYQEEQDDELFTIFQEHLAEQFGLLSGALSRSHQSPVNEKLLLEFSESVNRIKSSANYMDYGEMVGFCDGWGAAIEVALDAVSRGEIPSIDFMERYLDDLITTFPQLEDLREVGITTKAMEMPEMSDADMGDVSSSVLDAFRDESDSASAEQDVTSSVLDVFGSDAESWDDIGDITSSVDNSEENEFESAMKGNIDLTLIDDFIDESREHLDEMEALLLELMSNVDNPSNLNDIFRTMHNIKGASQLTGLDKISRLSHRMEDLLDMLRQGQMATTQAIVALLIAGHDRIEQLINELEQSQQETTSVDELIGELNALIEGTASVSSGFSEGDAGISTAVSTSDAKLTEQAIFGATVDASLPQISEQSFEEEHDQELFGIFVSHLGEQLGNIASNREQLTVRSNPHEQLELLENCISAVESMRSSANYMGYDELISFYKAWTQAIMEAIQRNYLGENISANFMDYYSGEVARVFPQLEKFSLESRSERQPQMVKKERPKIQRPKIAQTVVEKIPEASPASPASPASIREEQQENELFERMNSALGSSLDKVSNSASETLSEVFDVLMSSQETRESTVDTKSSSVNRSAIKPQQQAGRRQDERRKESDSGEKKLRKSIRVDAEKIDRLMNQVGELIVDRSYFFQLFNEMRDLQQHLKDTVGIDPKEVKIIRAFINRLSEAISGLGRTTNELQEGVMKMRMLPVSHLFNRYPRLVHDLTSNTDKRVNLVLRGEDTELDRMIVEELSDPLIHIIRNAIDHGIETTEERLKNGKDAEGQLILEAYHESNHIVIEVVDDGRGLDPEKIKQKVVSKGIFTRDEVDRLGKQELANLILLPGFSTAEKITGTSGRGVGMDVVKKNIEKLNGTLDIGSRLGKGARMRLKIPLTLAIIHALMVRVGKDIFTIPLANVDETVRIEEADTSLVEGVEVIHLRGVTLPIFRLSSLFKVPSDQNIDKAFVVIVNTDGQRIGFVVDELRGQEEVVIKPLEDYVQERSGFSGATIVGDGRISLILDVYELVKMTTSRQIKRHKQQAKLLRSKKSKFSEQQKETSERLH